MSTFLGKILISLLFFNLGIYETLNAKETSLSDLELIRIIERQKRLLEYGKNWSEDELKRQAQEIVTSYESFLLENPNDINALLLFGKFLRKTGLQDSAISLFLKADQINPNIAVVKQELGNFLVEAGKPVEAFPFFLMTTRLAPQEAVYHYNLGNFVFLFQDKLRGVAGSEKLGSLMHQSFKEATKLNPENFDYHLRFAQSFFDIEDSSHEEALLAWEVLINEFGERTMKEQDYIKINKSRILLHLKRFKEATTLLHSVKSEVMKEEKEKLLEKVRSHESSKNSYHFDRRYQKYKTLELKAHVFPIDANLMRIKQITAKLLQERMLDDLQRDVVQARVHPDGKISLELTSKDLSLKSPN